MKSESFLASMGLVVERLVELHGIDPDGFMKQVGLDPKLFRDPKARLPVQVADAVLKRAAFLIPDPAFALRAADCWHPSNLGALGYAWLSSGSLQTGLRRIERYTRILNTKAIDRCREEPGGVRYVYDHGRGDAPIGPVMADLSLSIVMAMCRMNFGAELYPVSVNLRRAMPKDPSPWRDFFGCEICFGANEDSFLLDRRTVEMPLPSANQDMAATFDRILTQQLTALSQTDLPTRCKVLLLQQLTSGEPSEEKLAGAMLMSRRTLQRKLADAGVPYKRLLDETRYDLAKRYLDDPQRSVTEITFLLGFSEQSAFTRAFKRWSGKSPTAHRSQQLALT